VMYSMRFVAMSSMLILNILRHLLNDI